MDSKVMSDAIVPVEPLERAISTYLKGHALNTQSSYRARLEKFQRWHADQPPAPFVEQLKGYIDYLRDSERLSPRSIQAHVNTIKGMARTAAALYPTLSDGLIGIDLAKAPAVRGQVQGDRLTPAQRQALIDAPGLSTCKGRRDTAILALMAICGLRRSEVAALNWQHVDELDGHKVIRNLSGKHGRVRTVKLPVALWRLITSWADACQLDRASDAPVFVAVRKGDTVQHGERLTSSAIGYLVDFYTARIGQDGISPHDLRRTAASLSRKGGASIEQVQHMLGHASPQTTSAYIGEALDLDHHAVDYGEFRIPA
jgi:integrase